MSNEDTTQDKSTEDEIVKATNGFWQSIGEIFKSDKKIGELNGKWAAMFKLSMIGMMCLIPTLFTWMVWVTSNVYDGQHHIDTNKDTISRIEQLEKADIASAQLLSKINTLNAKIDALPPEDWRRRIVSLEQGFNELPPDDWKRRVVKLESDSSKTQQLVVALDKANSTDHIKIETLLTEIKSSLKK